MCNIGEIDDDDDNDEFIPVSPSTIWGVLRGGYDINVGFILEEKKLHEEEERMRLRARRRRRRRRKKIKGRSVEYTAVDLIDDDGDDDGVDDDDD